MEGQEKNSLAIIYIYSAIIFSMLVVRKTIGADQTRL